MDLIDKIKEEIKNKPVLVIFPDGVVRDIEMAQPVVGNYTSIGGRNYRIVEAHDSVVAKWDYVCQLSN